MICRTYHKMSYRMTYILALTLINLVVFFKWEHVDFHWYLCKGSIVKQGILDYFLLSWSSKVLTGQFKNKVLCYLKKCVFHSYLTLKLSNSTDNFRTHVFSTQSQISRLRRVWRQQMRKHKVWISTMTKRLRKTNIGSQKTTNIEQHELHWKQMKRKIPNSKRITPNL